MRTADRWLHVLLALFCFASSDWCQALSQPGFQNVLQDVMPAIVHIQSPSKPLRPSSWPSPQQFFFQTPPVQGASVFALGTGFLIRPAGYCVTSYQIIEGVQTIEVVTADKRRIKASLLGGDRTLDLAVLKLEGSGYGGAALDFADSDKAVVGDAVIAIGRGLGFRPFLNAGLLSAKGNVLGSGVYDRHFVLDFATHPGNAGGPVIDSRGRVLGMATYAEHLPAQFGFALPSKLLQASLQDLIRHGKLQRAWLGLVAKNLTSIDSIAEAYDPSIRSGVLIENLIIEGPAARAGLQVGDLLLSAGAENLRDVSQLQALLGKSKAGQSLEFKIFRQKQGIVKVKVQVGEVPNATELPSNEFLL